MIIIGERLTRMQWTSLKGKEYLSLNHEGGMGTMVKSMNCGRSTSLDSEVYLYSATYLYSTTYFIFCYLFVFCFFYSQ
jgi:hypothetical protein